MRRLKTVMEDTMYLNYKNYSTFYGENMSTFLNINAESEIKNIREEIKYLENASTSKLHYLNQKLKNEKQNYYKFNRTTVWIS